MKKNNKLYLITLILSIWNLILFYGNSFGISFILFNIPTTILIIKILQKQNKIKNKYGLLFAIPIILLSISFLLYTSYVTTIFNFIAIIIFYLLMIIVTENKTYTIPIILDNALNIIFQPLDKLNVMLKDLTSNIKKKDNKNKKPISKETQNMIISIIFAIPIIIIILVLLSSADMMFGKIFDNFFTNIDLVLEKLTNIKINEVVFKITFRIIYLTMFFIYFTSSMFFLKHFYHQKEYPNSTKKYSELTIKPLLFVLNIIYILFDFIQIRSLIFHKISMNITYAEYARQGFFQLMFVSFINMILILIAKKFNPSDKKANKILSIIMIILTAVIVISSFMRMNMYEAAYGYTVLRLLVYVILITELILMIPTIIYIQKDNFNLLKYYIIIGTTIYTIIGILPLDNIIAIRNIEKYNKDNKIDIQYLMNNNYDNIPILLDFYNKVNDKNLKIELNEYFLDYQNNLEEHKKNNDFFSEYNISRARSLKKLAKKDFRIDRKELLVDSSYTDIEYFKEDKIEYELYTYTSGNEIYKNKEGYKNYIEDYKIDTVISNVNKLDRSNRLRNSDLTENDYYNIILKEHYNSEKDTYYDTFDVYYYDDETSTLHHITKKEE